MCANTTASSLLFKSILDDALSEYKKRTGHDLLDNWIAKEIESCDTIQEVLDIIQDEANTFDKFTGGGNKTLMKWIGSSLHVLYKISSILGSDVTKAHLPAHLAARAISSGIGLLLGASNKVKMDHYILVGLFERISFFVKRLGVYTQVSPTKDMVEVLVKIMAEIISILSIATREMQRSRAKTFILKLVGNKDIENALENLDLLTREEVQIAIAQVLKAMSELKDGADKARETAQQIENTMNEIKAGVREIKWNLIQKDVRTWFSPPDQDGKYVFVRRLYLEGTAAWFFKVRALKEWEFIGTLLWIHGKPGSGKSILCSAIIDHVIPLRDAGQASLAYFFFDFRDDQKQIIRNFLSSLLTQLATNSELCRGIAFRLYSGHDDGARKPTFDDMINCLKEMLKVIAQRPIYIIIDALDECPNMHGMPTPRETVLYLVKDIIQMQIPSLHMCITSRLEIDIKDVLGPLAYNTVSLHEESGQQEDIFNYTREVVYTNQKMQKWRDEEKELVVAELSSKADGMFRWVYCQLDALQHCFASSIRQILDELPDTLDETYARVLSQIPSANQAHARRMLQCLLVAVRPLRVEELAELLAIKFDTTRGAAPGYNASWRPNDQEKAVLTICSSLIAIVNDNGSQVVQFSHFSVKEFLMSDRLKSDLGDFSQYRILPGSAHSVLTQACVGSLLQLGNHTGEEEFPLVKYAAQYWITHAQYEGVASRVKNAMEALFDPDKPHFARWVGMHDIDDEYSSKPKSKIPTPLYYSSLCGFSDLVEHLAIKRPQDINAIGGRYDFPLLAALFEKHFQVAQILLKHGADVNCRRDDFITPLHLAAYYGEPKVAQVLLEHNAVVDSRDNGGNTMLHLLVAGGLKGWFQRFDNHPREVTVALTVNLACLLLGHSTDITIRTGAERTLRNSAIFERAREVVSLLLDHGANVNAENNQGETPLGLLVNRQIWGRGY